MKIRLDSYDDLPLNKISFFSVLDIIVKFVFQIGNEYLLFRVLFHKFT